MFFFKADWRILAVGTCAGVLLWVSDEALADVSQQGSTGRIVGATQELGCVLSDRG